MSPIRRTSASHDRAACHIEPFPLAQHQIVGWLGLMHRQHTVHALQEDPEGNRVELWEPPPVE